MQGSAMPDLSRREDQVTLDEHLEDISLIIVDNISTLCRSSKENDADAWIPVQEWALRMRASGRSVLFIHHAGKGGSQRGTSKREDILDTVIALQQSEDYSSSDGASFEIHFKKARGFFGADAEGFKARLTTDHEGMLKWESEPLTASTFDKVMALAKNGEKQLDIANKLNIHKSNVSRHLQRAKMEGKLHGCVA
jgi:putative DNA primase/helicase